MTEIPEHLLKRSAERRKALGLPGGEESPAEETPAAAAADAPAPETTAPAAAETPAAESDAPASAEAGKIPAHLLERSKRRKAALAGGGAAAGEGTAAAAGGGGTATATRPVAAPTATGPGGHTQRLLTVVKSGSIQQVKAETQDKVHTWPHLLVVEFTALLGITALLIIFSALVRAPLLGLADINQTPNPSKAPWYFLGLQELLTMFHPMVAGVTIPGIGLFMLMVAPYVDKNPSNKPSDRKFVVSLFTIFLMFWAVLVIIGSFFRGPGFNFVFPWNDGIFFEL
jgi:menaquinol-cytochrome c reductase cytochrome b/c subunit